MRIKSLLLRSVAVGFTCATLIGSVSLSFANDNVKHFMAKPSTPEGFDQVLLYMGTGIFDPANSEPRPGLTDCEGLFCDGMYFQKEVMNRTDDEIENLETDAKAFYKNRFGIDLDSEEFSGRASMSMFTVNPDFEYRVQMASSMNVNPNGWMIRDGGFRLDILDPEGISLGGDSEGLFAPPGSAMFFGHYNILATNNGDIPKEEIIIHYQSKFPAFTLENGVFMFACDMFHDDWGQGLGMGNIQFLPLNDGRMRGNGRNVLSFPPSSDLESFTQFPPINAHPVNKGVR